MSPYDVRCPKELRQEYYPEIEVINKHFTNTVFETIAFVILNISILGGIFYGML